MQTRERGNDIGPPRPIKERARLTRARHASSHTTFVGDAPGPSTRGLSVAAIQTPEMSLQEKTEHDLKGVFKDNKLPTYISSSHYS